jgi:CRP-like cAMP-binding protein
MPLAEDDFALLKKQTKLVHFKKKQLLTTAGESELHLYFIVSGLIREYFYKGSEQITSDLIAEGTITGSVTSFFTGAPSHYCLEAMEPVTAISIHKGQLEELYRSDRKWEKFGRILTTHFLLQQERHILDSSRLNTKERFLHFMQQYPELLNRVPQKYLASFLQIKPETFSRMKHLLVVKNKKTVVS